MADSFSKELKINSFLDVLCHFPTFLVLAPDVAKLTTGMFLPVFLSNFSQNKCKYERNPRQPINISPNLRHSNGNLTPSKSFYESADTLGVRQTEADVVQSDEAHP